MTRIHYLNIHSRRGFKNGAPVAELSILGRDPPGCWQHEENIPKEYTWIPEGV
jgi:hypothetical protein